MLDDGFDGEIAGEFTVCLATHAIGNDIQAELGLDAVGVLIIVSDAPNICARSHINLHTVPLDCWQANKAAREAQAATERVDVRGNPEETVQRRPSCGRFQLAILNSQEACHALSRADLVFSEL
jgi:hypothetical protein